MNINSNSEQKVDFDYILDKGVADYSDGDIVIFEQIGDKSLNGSVKLDMIMLAYCQGAYAGRRQRQDIHCQGWRGDDRTAQQRVQQLYDFARL